ncbi:MAG: hypothetical protein OEU68_10760 [Nitrospira sp.]|nr:hypothetical protein [Nitrospira sp.]MDH4243382.1 hypothetical protein [Nitrospira sp.]MDH4355798.1 hypothetical protein [Nitrospira sp.]MDH5318031.1 hypothetical protein [Nitrospira sp.]
MEQAAGLFFYLRERLCVELVQKTMKLPLTIAAPLLTSLGALRPIRKIKMNHGQIVYKTLAVGRTYVVQEGYIRLIHIEGDGRTNFWDLIGIGGMFGDLPFALTMPQQIERAITGGSTCLLEFSRAALERERQSVVKSSIEPS